MLIIFILVWGGRVAVVTLISYTTLGKIGDVCKRIQKITKQKMFNKMRETKQMASKVLVFLIKWATNEVVKKIEQKAREISLRKMFICNAAFSV